VCRWGYEGISDLGCIGKYFFPPKIWVMTAFCLLRKWWFCYGNGGLLFC
jgi:hypothetical protein